MSDKFNLTQEEWEQVFNALLDRIERLSFLQEHEVMVDTSSAVAVCRQLLASLKQRTPKGN